MVVGSALERRLRKEITGDILFDKFSRGRYSTDASFYQMMPQGVVVPKTIEDVEACISAARDEGIPVLPRGGGTSQCGQTVNHALVVDNSKYLNRILELDVENRRCVVEPGIVLDELNRALKPHGLWFPVDVSTASRATIGGMSANNSCGGRSIRYGIMRDNVHSIEAILAGGEKMRFGSLHPNELSDDMIGYDLISDLLALGADNAEEIIKRFPKVLRRVGGYNIDALMPSNDLNNLSNLLVGSEGTLAYSTAIELKLSPIIKHKVLGVCHFPTFHSAMDATQHLVKLGAYGVELVDATMIALARDIDLFRPTIEQVVRGNPEALLLVEFGEDDPDDNLKKLDELEEAMGDLGFSWKGEGKNWGGVAPIIDTGLQNALVEVRKAGLNIMMSMKDQGKPVSFVEDCAVELPDLADYTDGLTEIFAKHGTKGTWYAHASVGCLHVRPVLNLRQEVDVKTMRAIAEEAFELVHKYKGSHSGEHGDGIVRSEFHERMFGPELVRAFEQVKERFDPSGLFNPGKIVHAPKMDDRSLFRYNQDYTVGELDTVLDWSAWPGAGGGFQGAVEMCNNNGACRKLTGGVMCPSYRATRNEKDATRGRANVLRLAISGQLGEDAFASDAMMEAMELCVSCKGCRRECPTGVDMARMKIEVLAARNKKHGLSLNDLLVGFLPAYAPIASRIPWLMNLRDTIPGVAKVLEKATGFSAKRALPKWHSKSFMDDEFSSSKGKNGSVVLFADPFNRYFEPENLRAAGRVLEAAGINVEVVKPLDGGKPLHSGRTFLSVGLVDKAKEEAQRLVDSLLAYAMAGTMIIGLEPSSLLTLRDEIPALLPGSDTELIASHALMFEEYIAQKIASGEFDLKLKSPASKLLLHGHCHQKSFDIMSDIEKTLALLPDTEVETINSGCCGMAGSFGYGVNTFETSIKMGEMALFPAIRDSDEDVLIVADGTSCRHQIADGTGRKALHVARILELALDRV
ncbi:MAG: FAD-binding oxidoreductase [Hyphomicrobiales bacterium]|nr:MAG: FAD-binding oxidoreductase [Hyphomicrobiales bacterium]